MSSSQQSNIQPTRDTAHNIKSAASDLGSRVQHTASDVTHGLAQQGKEAWDQVAQGTKESMERMTKEGLEPALRTSAEVTARQPMLATFAACMFLFSSIPCGAFLSFSLGTVAVVTGTCLAIGLAVCTTLIGGAGLLLLGPLSLALMCSCAVTALVVSAFAAYRLIYCLSNEPSLPEAIERFRGELLIMIFGEMAMSRGSKRGQPSATRALGITPSHSG